MMSFDKEELLKQIKKGKIKIKPKWMFLVRLGSIFLAAILSALFLLFVLGTIVFLMFYQANMVGIREMVTFRMLFSILPWTLIFVAIFFLLIFEISLSGLLPLYRKSVLLVTLAVVLIVIALSFLINSTMLFKSIYSDERPNLMITRQWTQDHQKRINQYIKEGEVIERGEEGLLAIELKEGEIVYVQEKDSFLAKGIIGRLKVGDLVLVSGFETEEGFEVFKIRPRINRKNFLNEINDEEKRNNTWIGREENPRFNNFKQ